MKQLTLTGRQIVALFCGLVTLTVSSCAGLWLYAQTQRPAQKRSIRLVSEWEDSAALPCRVIRVLNSEVTVQTSDTFIVKTLVVHIVPDYSMLAEPFRVGQRGLVIYSRSDNAVMLWLVADDNQKTTIEEL